MTELNGHIFKKIFDQDGVRGCIYSYKIDNIILCGETYEYPNIKFEIIESGAIFNPIFEKTMSLSSLDENKFFKYKKNDVLFTIENPLFFFCFNFENYYHFIYDTLPYLVTFLELKKDITNLKLLVPNLTLNDFVIETFELLKIEKGDLIKLSNVTRYKEVYFSDSFTHGENSNIPPHKGSKLIYKILIDSVVNRNDYSNNVSKVYVSRRSWVHGRENNIGTNYTDRRILINETDLVNFLKERNFTEIFTENMSMIDKINLFHNLDFVVGPIGGGLVNCLFSKKNSTVLVINSPTFLEVNKRFLFSFDNLNTIIYDKSFHVDGNEWKRYQRVFVEDQNIFGEILKISDKKLFIKFTDKMISGFNKKKLFNTKWVLKNKCRKLDDGLNSPFEININNFEDYYDKGNFSFPPRMD